MLSSVNPPDPSPTADTIEDAACTRITKASANAPSLPSNNSNLFDLLPEDVLDSILSGNYGLISPTTLVELACTSRTAAALTLPILYSCILVPSLPALAKLHAVLSAKPDLAQRVRSLTASEYFVESGQFSLASDVLSGPAKLAPQSSIVSVDKVQERCGTKLLNMLPMAWFTRIARICPNLVSVDISRVPDMGTALPCLTFGLLDIARILRDRGGRIISSPNAPISAVVVNDAVRYGQKGAGFDHKLYHVSACDWGRKQIDITKDMQPPSHLSLVPFSDLTSTSLVEQIKWTIHNATICAGADPTYSFDTSPNGWIRHGVRATDRIFDLSQTRQIFGNVSLLTSVIGWCSKMLDYRNIRPADQCAQISWVGPDAYNSYMLKAQDAESGNDRFDSWVEKSLVDFSDSLSQPWRVLSTFSCYNTYYLTTENTPRVLQQIAGGMPSLARLELRNLHIPMDFVMTHLDCMIRRGTPRLHSLALSTYVPDEDDPPLSTASYTLPATAQDCDPPGRTDLDATQPNPGHLHTLELSIEGRDLDHLPHFAQPTVAIHPGLLHGLTHLSLQSVKLAVMPPHLAHASAPSFLPLSAFTRDPHLTRRTPLTLQHVTLRALTHLSINTLALLPLVDNNEYTPYRVPAALPHAPMLVHLVLVAADKQHFPLTGKNVHATLLRYARLVRARIGYARVGAAQVQDLVRGIMWPAGRWAACARLRNLVVDNMDLQGKVTGQLLSVPHAVHILDTRTSASVVGEPAGFVEVARTSVEVDGGTGAAAASDGRKSKQCGKCGLVVDMPVFIRGRAFGMVPCGPPAKSPEALCPVCGPRAAVRVWKDGHGVRQDADVEGPKLWCWDGPRQEPIV